MEILGIVLWIIGLLITLSWAFGIRTYARSRNGVSQQTVNQAMLFAVSLLVVPIFSFSPIHLLWMFPAGFILGVLSVAVPFSVLSIPGRIFGAFCCVGLAGKNSIGKGT